MTEVVMTTGAVRLAKLQSNRRHAQSNQHPAFYRLDALLVTHPTASKALDGNSALNRISA